MQYETTTNPPTRTHRFVNAVLRFPYIRICWAICTFGYSFPRIRRGENLGFCIAKSAVILVTRLSCILGAIWYINNWFQYRLQGIERPFNKLERQITRDYGTTVPLVNLYSSEVGKILVSGVFYSNKTAYAPMEYSVDSDTWSNDKGDEMLLITPYRETMRTDTSLQSIHIEITHVPPLPRFGWSVVGLLHPQRNSTTFSNQDMQNQYHFLPGHFVEIRYTPVHLYEAYRIEGDENPSLLQRFKSFLGYDENQEDFSYESTVSQIPFPEGLYNNMTTVIIIRAHTNLEIISYAEEKVTFRDTMSKIGGLIGVVGSIIVFLFGASLLSPWGYVAGLRFFRQRISASMAMAYDTQDGLSKGPFTTQFEETGKFDPEIVTMEQKIVLLKERIDELEMVLSEYYLDPEVFQNYAEERSKLKLGRKVSLVSCATGKASLAFSPDQQQEQQQEQQSYQQSPYAPGHYRRPSETLRESQHQHKGPLPSPQNPASYARQSIERGYEPEMSVSAYYQQQQQQQQSRGQRKQRNNSEQSLLRIASEDGEEEEDEDPASPIQASNLSTSDQQRQGLLQQDHYLMRQSFLQQQQQRPPSFPPRPRKETIIPMAIKATPAPSSVSPSPRTSHPAFTASTPDDSNGSGSMWRKSEGDTGSLAAALTPRVQMGSPGRLNSEASSAVVGSRERGGGNDVQYEELDMSDLSRMP